MNWEIEYLPEAAKDIEELNKSVYPQVLNGIMTVVVVSMRADNQAFNEAAPRTKAVAAPFCS